MLMNSITLGATTVITNIVSSVGAFMKDENTMALAGLILGFGVVKFGIHLIPGFRR